MEEVNELSFENDRLKSLLREIYRLTKSNILVVNPDISKDEFSMQHIISAGRILGNLEKTIDEVR